MFRYLSLLLIGLFVWNCEDYERIDIKVIDGKITEINGEPKTEFELENEY